MMPPQAAAVDDPATAAFPTGSAIPPDLLSELPHEAAFAVWQVLRCLELWTAEPESGRGEVFDAGFMERWERRLLTSPLEPEARFPLAVVVGEMAAPSPGGGRLPWACVCVADWALGRGARRVGLAFAEAAARTVPQQPRYAWLAGRLLRGHGNARDGERWLRRAHRLAVAQRDWETQARSLTSLGNLLLEVGRHGDARQFHSRALRVAQRHHLREQEAMALHDLFAIAIQENKRVEAEAYARGAFAAYRRGDQRIAMLAHDVAYFWLYQGHFARALSVFQAVRPHFPHPDEALRVMANVAHAAGGAGDRALFDSVRCEAEALIPLLDTGVALAPALLEIACGAALLREWGDARELAARASEAAQLRRESNVIVRAAALSEAVASEDDRAVQEVAVWDRQSWNPSGEQFAVELVASLEPGRADGE
jgi:hypothetical protein